MPYIIKLHRDQDLTVIVLQGEISTGEPLEAIKAFYAGGPTTNALWDFREATGGEITSDEIRGMYEVSMKNMLKRPNGRTVFVAPTDHEFGLARMTATIGELTDVPLDLHAFRTLEEAVQWLGVRYPQS